MVYTVNMTENQTDKLFTCGGCKILKPRNDYYATDQNKRGFKYHCITCFNGRRAKARTRDPRQCMLVAARTRAKRRGLPCTITIDDIVIPSHCPILGMPLAVKTGSKGSADHSPSLDAIEPDKGYIAGNVQVISMLANQMKSSANLEQLAIMGEWATRRAKRISRESLENKWTV
jgi:hypothetical protein